MQAPDHGNRKIALAIQHFGHPRAGADDRLQILAGEPLLLHTEFDSLDGVGRVHGIMLRLIDIDQGSQDLKTIPGCGAVFGTPELLEVGQRPLVIRLRLEAWLKALAQQNVIDHFMPHVAGGPGHISNFLPGADP